MKFFYKGGEFNLAAAVCGLLCFHYIVHPVYFKGQPKLEKHFNTILYSSVALLLYEIIDGNNLC